MARPRMVRPEWLERRAREGMSLLAQILSLILPLLADDHGRLLDAPKAIAGAGFPLEDDITTAMVRDALDEIEKAGWIRRYCVDGVRCIYVENWTVLQKVDHPSKPTLPEPPSTDVVSISGELHEDLPSVSDDGLEKLAPNLVQLEGNSVQVNVGRSGRSTAAPESLAIPESLRAQYFDLDVDDELTRFLDHALSVDRRLVDWTAGFRNWLKKARDFKASSKTTAAQQHASGTEFLIREVQANHAS